MRAADDVFAKAVVLAHGSGFIVIIGDGILWAGDAGVVKSRREQ